MGYGTILSEQDYELWKMREQIEKFVENHKVKTVMWDFRKNGKTKNFVVWWNEAKQLKWGNVERWYKHMNLTAIQSKVTRGNYVNVKKSVIFDAVSAKITTP